jgi:hypothetical protein
MDNGDQYRMTTHIMGGQKEMKVSGLPFFTIPQIMGAITVMGFVMVFGIPFSLALFFALVAIAGAYVHNGEYVLLRAFRIIQTAVQVRINSPRIIALDAQWQKLNDAGKQAPRAAFVYRAKGGVSMVSSSSDANED